jgi:hypothetical protein
MHLVFGPTFSFTPPTPEPAPKVDVAVTIKSLDGNILTVTVPAYDLSTHHQLLEIRAYLVPSGATAPSDPLGYDSSTFPFAKADVSTLQAGGDVALTLPAVTGQQAGQVVLGFVD